MRSFLKSSSNILVMGYFVKTIARLKTDIEYKRKLCLTAALCFSYVVLVSQLMIYLLCQNDSDDGLQFCYDRALYRMAF